ncbi:MAG: tetratricopeptide repeat protein [bacterium]|nr:tetratricopeptide repeat protein [bacterium]
MSSRGKQTLVLTSLAILAAGCASKKAAGIDHRTPPWLEADNSAVELVDDIATPDIQPRTHYAAGQLFEQQGLLRKAIIQYRRCIAAESGYVAAHNRLGVLLGRLGQHPDAELALQKAVALRPDWAFLRNNLGFEYILQLRWDAAEKELRQAIRLKPGFARAHNNLAMVLFRMGRVEESLDEFRRALPEADAYYNLGLMLNGQRRYRESAEAFEHVLTVAPRFEAAETQLARIAPHLHLQDALLPAPELSPWDAVATATPVTETTPPATEPPPTIVEPLENEVDCLAEEVSIRNTRDLIAAAAFGLDTIDESGQTLAVADLEEPSLEELITLQQDRPITTALVAVAAPASDPPFVPITPAVAPDGPVEQPQPIVATDPGQPEESASEPAPELWLDQVVYLFPDHPAVHPVDLGIDQVRVQPRHHAEPRELRELVDEAAPAPMPPFDG